MADEKINIVVSLKDEASKGVSKITKSFEDLKGKIKVGAAAALTALSVIIKKSVDAFAEEEKAVIQLKAALKATGQEVENNSKEMIAYASELQRTTTVGDETSIALMQVATNMGLNSKQAQAATRDAIGLSKAYGVDAQAAIKAVTAAQLGDYNMLNRYIPSLRTVTDETEKAALAKRLLASAFDVAKAETQTYAGAMMQLQNSIGDASEKIGAALAPALTAVAKVIGTVAEWFNNLTPSAQKMSGVLVGVAAAVSALAVAFTFLTWPIIATAAAIAAVVAGFILLANATAPLSEKTARLTSEQDKLKNKADELKDRLKALADQGKENSSEYLKLQKELNNTNKDMAKNEIQLRKNIKALQDEKKAIEDKIVAQKAAAEGATGDKKIKELEKLEAMEAQRLEIIAASKDAEQALLVEKEIAKNEAINNVNAENRAFLAESEAVIKEGQKQQDAIEAEQFKQRLFAKSNMELQAMGMTAKQITAIRKAQDAEMKQNFDSTMGYLASGMQSKNKELFAIGKAASMAQAIISGAQAFNVALASAPPPFNFALAAGVAAIAADKVATINSTQLQLAEGGIVQPQPGGVSATIAEAGSAEAVIPLDSDEGRSALGGGTTNVYISGKPLAKEMYEIQQEMIRTGELSA